ncbi:MAG: AAA family ATPase [Pseudomonadota bacterium]|jgi:predicted ATPase
MPHLQEIKLLFHKYPSEERYPFDLPLLKVTRTLAFPSPITLFAGENGSGKSTLLRALARSCGIHIWEMEQRRRLCRSPHEENLHNYLSLTWSNGSVPGSYFSSEIFRDFAAALDEFAVSDPGMLRYFGGRSLVNQSHGESLLSYFGSRYLIKGLYLLDEPETALSPASQVKLIKIIAEAAARGDAQFIIASHSPILLACPGATIYNFDVAPPRVVQYEDTEYYKVYKDFMEDRGKFLGCEPESEKE